MLSNTCTYGIRATAYLASREEGSFVPIREIASALDLSFHFLSKFLHRLVAERLVESYRGPNGGARLARPASGITVHDVIVAIDGPGLFEKCVLGLPGCGNESPCPLHAVWAHRRGEIAETFRARTLADMAGDYRDQGNRL